MRLQYLTSSQLAIVVYLDAGEQLGHLVGPTDNLRSAVVPVQPGNLEYDEIVREGFTIEPAQGLTP